MFTFLHLADLHLDSPLKGLDRYEGSPAEEIRNATRRAFENAISLAIARDVDFVLVAGDVYDGDWRDYNTGLYFIGQASRLREANIPMVVISGNHDAANRMTTSLKLPDNVRYLSSRHPESLVFGEIGVAIHGQGFATAAVHDDLSSGYPAAQKGLFNIGLLHTCGSGRAGHERYAPCSLEGLKSKGYDYWALGHVHTRETLCETPFVAFSGNPQGRHIRETGPKGCLVVDVTSRREVVPEFCPLDVLRWERIDVDLEGATNADDLLARVTHGLSDARSKADGLPLACRIALGGTTDLHASLHADTDRWINEIRSQAIRVGGGTIWLEKMSVHTRPPHDRSALAGAVDGPLGEIIALTEELRNGELGWDDDIAEMLRRLPAECIDGGLFETAEGRESLVAAAESLVLSHLMGKEGSP